MYFFFKKLVGFFCALTIGWVFTVQVEADTQYPVIDYAHVANPALVKKGEYLAKTGDCIACHTNSNHGGKPFAGGLGIETPFGAFYSPNITADEATGIGSWTDKQFIAAVRQGNGPQGNYFPVFPFLYFNKMTDDDVLAIKAYLFAVPKIYNPATPNQVPWPFNVRLAQYAWKILFFYPYEGVYTPDPLRSPAWNRGAYLVEGPAHCGMCHSPLNMLGAEKRRYRYTGGFVQGFYAPDITSVGLKPYSIKQIVGVLQQGKTLAGQGQVAGPMLEAYRDSFRYLSDYDASSIAIYLKTVKSNEQPKSSGVVTSTTGAKLYGKYCAACHANGANGAPIVGNKADWQARLKAGISVVMNDAIHGINAMPPMGNCMTCSQEQIRATVQYMIDNSINVAASDDKPKAQDYFYGMVHLSPEQGQALYHTHCAICHDANVQGEPNAPKMGDYALWAQIFAQKNFDDVLDTVLNGENAKTQAVHPVHGGCGKCSTPEIIAASKYLAEQNANGKYDFSLW